MVTKTPISALQELMAQRKLTLPVYKEESEGFSFKCSVSAAGVIGIGFGPTKKSAKHASAQNALEKLQALPKSPQFVILQQSPPPLTKPLKNYVGDLNEFASKNQLKYPDYEEYPTYTISSSFISKCSFLGTEVFGTGLNKKDAKQDAAKRMLQQTESSDFSTKLLESKYSALKIKTTVNVPNNDDIIAMYNQLSTSSYTKSVSSNNNNHLEASPNITVNKGDTLDVLQRKLRHNGIEYTLEELQRRPCYIVHVRIKGTDLSFCGAGPTHQEATRTALQTILEVKKTGCCLNTNDLISLED